MEIVDNSTCVILLKGEDKARSLDERVERFLKKYAYEKLTVIDTKEYDLPGIDTRFRAYFTPVILNLCLVESLTPAMQAKTGLSQKTRRYYGVVDY
mgnify:FL=1